MLTTNDENLEDMWRSGLRPSLTPMQTLLLKWYWSWRLKRRLGRYLSLKNCLQAIRYEWETYTCWHLSGPMARSENACALGPKAVQCGTVQGWASVSVRHYEQSTDSLARNETALMIVRTFECNPINLLH